MHQAHQFELPAMPPGESLSPRLAWMRSRGIVTKYFPEVQPGDENEFGNDLWPWVAVEGMTGDWSIVPKTSRHVGVGRTEEDALIDLAVKLKIPSWRKENFYPECQTENQPQINTDERR